MGGRILVAACAGLMAAAWAIGCGGGGGGGGGHQNASSSNTLCAPCQANEDAIDTCIDACDDTCDTDAACNACYDRCDGCGAHTGLGCTTCSDNCAPNAPQRCVPMDDVTQCQDGMY